MDPAGVAGVLRGASYRADFCGLRLVDGAVLRGTAYGFFNLMCGIAMLLASGLAGLLWDRYGASFTFYAGAVFCVIALLGLLAKPVLRMIKP